MVSSNFVLILDCLETIKTWQVDKHVLYAVETVNLLINILGGVEQKITDF